MVEENINQQFWLKNIDETRNFYLEEIEENKLMSRNHKKSLYNSKLYWTLFLILAPAITGCISISTFASLIGIPIGITSSMVDFKIW